MVLFMVVQNTEKNLFSHSGDVQFTLEKHPGQEENQSLCSPSPQLQWVLLCGVRVVSALNGTEIS